MQAHNVQDVAVKTNATSLTMNVTLGEKEELKKFSISNLAKLSTFATKFITGLPKQLSPFCNPILDFCKADPMFAHL
jgi:hypothetical protein